MSDSVLGSSFREALARFASGVTIVTARGADGPAGFTASAFSSVSVAPPLVLVCVGRLASAHDAVVSAARFGVSILAERQGWIAEQFARSGVDRFRDVPLRAGARVPLVAGALAQLECRPYARYDGGDHTILIGEVVDVVVAPGEPLVHFARRFGAFASAPFASHDTRAIVSKGERA